MKDYPFSKTWSAGRVASWTLAAFLLLGSWFWPVSRAAWDIFDLGCFQALNATVAWGYPWAVYWALTGDNLFDIVVALIVLGAFFRHILCKGRGYCHRGIGLGIVTAAILLVVLGLQRELISWPRPSPSLVVGEYHSIRQTVPWSRAKEDSPSSFPGDHATVIMIMLVLWWPAFGRRMGCGLLFLTVIFSLPRMAAGAHWMSDALVGGGFVVFLILGFFYGTPLGWRMYQLVLPLATRIEDRLLR